MARIDRINEEMRNELAKLLPSLKDPRLSGGLVSITRVDAASDLSKATVYFSVLGGDHKEVARGFRSASGFIRRELARSLQLRNTPELFFQYDVSIERGTHLLELIREIEQELPSEETEEELEDEEIEDEADE